MYDGLEEFCKLKKIANMSQKENGCSYDLDFSKVYWNSRLATEHERIVELLSPMDTVCTWQFSLVEKKVPDSASREKQTICSVAWVRLPSQQARRAVECLQTT